MQIHFYILEANFLQYPYKNDHAFKVKKKQHERKSQPKEITPSNVETCEMSTKSNLISKNSSDKEELEFNLEEDLDIPQGRQNKFSSV